MEPLDNDMVEIEVEIPRWMDVAARERNIDLSAFFINALKKYLGIKE